MADLHIPQYFEERPVWTRQALLNQFTPSEARDIHKCVFFVRHCCCWLSDWPTVELQFKIPPPPRLLCILRWTMAWYITPLRLRTKEESRRADVSFSHSQKLALNSDNTFRITYRYQRIYFRNANHPISRPSVISRRERPPNINAPSKIDDDYITKKTDRR